MKRLFLLIAISLIVFGCSDDNKTNQIVGQWKLIFRHSNPRSSYVSDESAKNIVYDFKSNGVLIVTGNQSAPHTDGQHNYFFGEDILGGLPSDPRILLVKIDGGKWTYNLSGGQMVLSQGYLDGETITFVRK
jgi:hypothetical protein